MLRPNAPGTSDSYRVRASDVDPTSAEYRELHAKLIRFRNKAYAHTDRKESKREATATSEGFGETWVPWIQAADVPAVIALAEHQRDRFRRIALEILDAERARLRELGLDLLEATARYETPTFPAEQGGTAVLLALAGRARRLLRAAYLLIDAGFELESVELRRALIEWERMVGWLMRDPDTNLWILQRQDTRYWLEIDRDMRAVGESSMSDDARRDAEELVAAITARLTPDGIDENASPPTVADLTEDEPFVDLAYRYDSQIASHPTFSAARELFTVDETGAYQLHAHPKATGALLVDSYAVCATALSQLVLTIEARLPEPLADLDRIETIRTELAQHAAAFAERHAD